MAPSVSAAEPRGHHVHGRRSGSEAREIHREAWRSQLHVERRLDREGHRSPSRSAPARTLATDGAELQAMMHFQLPPAHEPEQRSVWRFMRSALESRPAPRSAGSSAAAAAGDRSRGGFWANARALGLILGGPSLFGALQFGLPYHSIPHHVARAFLLGLLTSLGAGANGAFWFSTFTRAPLRRISLAYAALFVALSSALFAALDAAVDLARIPFATLGLLLIFLVSNQICSRLLARLYFRRVGSIFYGGGAASSSNPDVALPSSFRSAPGSSHPSRAFVVVGRFQSLSSLLLANPALRSFGHLMPRLQILGGYLFLFSYIRSTVVQVFLNIAVTSVCFFIVLLQLKLFGGSLLASMPHGDAAVIHVLNMMINVRVLRQLAFFQVKSVTVYLVSIATDLLSLLLPLLLLLRRFARPFARRAVPWLRARSAAPADARQGEGASTPAPTSTDAATIRSPSRANPTPESDRAERPSLSEHPAERASGGKGIAASSSVQLSTRSAHVAALGAAVSIASPSPVLDSGYGPGAGAGAGDPDASLWVYNVQHGIRTMLLWNAVVAWAACAIFATAVAVARFGPGAASFPYSPATFSRADFENALIFSAVTAGFNAAVVAAMHAAAAFFPNLRDHLGLAPSWRFLREHAFTLAFMFWPSTGSALIAFNRQTNIYYFVFPENYVPLS
eukprot:tig00020816_g14104.t1